MAETDHEGPDEDNRAADEGPQPDDYKERQEEPAEEVTEEEGSAGRSLTLLSPETEKAIEEYRDERLKAEEDVPRYIAVLAPELDDLNAAKLEDVDAVPTPYAAWNSVCRDEGGGLGLARGWNVLLAGNTGMGKSLLAINIAAHAIKQGEKVGIISLEMSKAQMITRYLSIFTGKPIRSLEWGRHYDEAVAGEAKAVVEENYEENGGVLYTNERQVSSLHDILASMRYLHEYHGCKYFVTDYLQLAWAGDAQKINDRVTEVSHGIQTMAVALSVVSIGVSQFNRATSSSKEKPEIQGMMGSSSLENDGDQVLLLDHTSYKETGAHGALIKLLAAKNRHGSSGEIPLMWDYTTLRAEQCDSREFEEAAG